MLPGSFWLVSLIMVLAKAASQDLSPLKLTNTLVISVCFLLLYIGTFISSFCFFVCVKGPFSGSKESSTVSGWSFFVFISQGDFLGLSPNQCYYWSGLVHMGRFGEDKRGCLFTIVRGYELKVHSFS